MITLMSEWSQGFWLATAVTNIVWFCITVGFAWKRR